MENAIKKVTKKDMFTKVMALLPNNAEIKEFCTHEIELLDKKASRKVSKKSTKNETIMADVFNILDTNEPMQIKGIIKELRALSSDYADISSQKVVGIVKGLGSKVTRTEVKGVAYFTVTR